MKNVKKAKFALLFAFAVLALASALNAEPGPGWGPDTQLTTHTTYDWRPSIIQTSDGRIWVVWGSGRTGNFDIWYKTSSDGGASWSADTQLTTHTADDDSPSIIQTSDGRIWVVFYSYRSSPNNPDIYYMNSSDGGANWSTAVRLTTDSDFDLNPSIVQLSDGKIFVAWQSDRIKVWDDEAQIWIPQDDIYYKTSSDGGATWTADTRLTTDPRDDVDPSVTQTADGKIWIAFGSSRLDPFHIYYTTSSDGGANWSTQTQLTTYEGDDWAPSITQTADGKIWVMFHSRRPLYGNWDIYYKTTSNGGADWTPDIRLTDHADIDAGPSITQTAEGKIWVFFASTRTGNYDVWYKAFIVHDVAITSVTAPNTVYQGGTVNILVGVANEGTESETFIVTVYASATVVDFTSVTLSPGITTTLTFSWNTKNVPLGNYAISAQASTVPDETDINDNTLIDGTLKVKIPGDVNGDGIVNIIDLVLLRIAYGSTPTDPNWNPEADLNQDGAINIFDALILGSHWWQRM